MFNENCLFDIKRQLFLVERAIVRLSTVLAAYILTGVNAMLFSGLASVKPFFCKIQHRCIKATKIEAFMQPFESAQRSLKRADFNLGCYTIQLFC